MMRLAVMVLLLLAGAKVWTQHQIFRSATEEALVQAYRGQAIATCRTAPVGTAAGKVAEAAGQRLATAFAQPAATRLEIGNRDVSVAIWEVDHAAWAMRYTYPYVVLETTSPAARCAYDIKLGRAHVTVY